MYGQHHSDAAKLKMSQTSTGIACKTHVKTLFGKPVRCIDTGTEYYAAIEAERQTGACNSSILRCCNKQRNTAGGLHWEYVERSE